MKARSALLLLPLLLATALLGVALIPTAPTEAQGRLSAQIYFTQARIPRNLSERALIRFARGHRATLLNEETDKPIPERFWRAEVVTAFNRPINDLEFHLAFYDVENGPRRFLEDMTIMTADRTQKTIVSTARLPRPKFVPNHEIEVVATVRRQEVGRTRLRVVGEPIRHSGTVDFEEDFAPE